MLTKLISRAIFRIHVYMYCTQYILYFILLHKFPRAVWKPHTLTASVFVMTLGFFVFLFSVVQHTLSSIADLVMERLAQRVTAGSEKIKDTEEGPATRKPSSWKSNQKLGNWCFFVFCFFLSQFSFPCKYYLNICNKSACPLLFKLQLMIKYINSAMLFIRIST